MHIPDRVSWRLDSEPKKRMRHAQLALHPLWLMLLPNCLGCGIL